VPGRECVWGRALGRDGVPVAEGGLETWTAEAKRRGRAATKASMEAVQSQWVADPLADPFLPEVVRGVPKAMPAEEVTRVVSILETVGEDAKGLWIAFGTHMDTARRAVLAAKAAAVDGGEATAKLEELLTAARGAADVEKEVAKTMGFLKGSQGPLHCDKALVEDLGRGDEALRLAQVLSSSSEHHFAAGCEYMEDVGDGRAGIAVSRAQECARNVRADAVASMARGEVAFRKFATENLVPDYEGKLGADAPEPEVLGALGSEATCALLPAVVPKYKAFVDAWAMLGGGRLTSERRGQRERGCGCTSVSLTSATPCAGGLSGRLASRICRTWSRSCRV
jgi:hypothetical protein